MIVYRQQVAKELKVTAKILQRAAEETLGASGASGGAASGGSPSRTGLNRSRDFAGATQFDRLQDQRTPKEIYGTERMYKADHAVDFGASVVASHDYAEGLPDADELRTKYGSPHKRVAVTKQFYRGNGVWSSITGSP